MLLPPGAENPSYATEIEKNPLRHVKRGINEKNIKNVLSHQCRAQRKITECIVGCSAHAQTRVCVVRSTQKKR